MVLCISRYISSRENKRVKFIAKLQNNSKFRSENGLFVIEGLRLCLDAAQNGFSINTLIYTTEIYKKHSSDIEFIKSKSLEVFETSTQVFEKISDTKSPQGVLCVCSVPEIRRLTEINSQGKYIFLENTNNPSNLGTISRTAQALGISGIIISDKSCDPFGPKALRASMGSLLKIPLYIISNCSDALNYLKNVGYSLYASVPDPNATHIDKIDFGKKSVILIGNEANGLTEETILLCDYRITIPMKGNAESLNAAAAAAILIWEISKD